MLSTGDIVQRGSFYLPNSVPDNNTKKESNGNNLGTKAMKINHLLKMNFEERVQECVKNVH